MAANITDDEWDELSPDNFDTMALLSAVDAVDELRSDLNDNEDGAPPQLRDDLLKLHQRPAEAAPTGDGSDQSGIAQPGSRSVRPRGRSGRSGSWHDDSA